MRASLPWNPWTHFLTALPEWVMVPTTRFASYWILSFVGKSSKSSRILPHPLSSWANSRTSWGMWWCTLHHHGSQGAHHDIPSKAHPLTSLLEHRANFAYTTIVHFTNGSGTWSLLNVLLLFLGKFITAAPKSNFLLELCFPHIHHFKLVFSIQGIGHHVFLPELVPNVHIEQGQCVLPSHLFWWQLWLGGKILQGHIIGPHHHVLGAYVMAPSLETMYHGPHFLLMGWPPLFHFTQLFAFKSH